MTFPTIFFLRRILVVCLFYIDIISVRYAAILYPIQIPYFYYLFIHRPLKEGMKIELVNEAGINLFFMIVPLYS
jgi:hypothetical protein